MFCRFGCNGVGIQNDSLYVLAFACRSAGCIHEVFLTIHGVKARIINAIDFFEILMKKMQISREFPFHKCYQKMCGNKLFFEIK